MHRFPNIRSQFQGKSTFHHTIQNDFECLMIKRHGIFALFRAVIMMLASLASAYIRRRERFANTSVAWSFLRFCGVAA